VSINFLKSVKKFYIAEVAGVTFSDSASVSKFLNPDLGPTFFQIWESDSCSNSGNNRCNQNSEML